MIHTPYKVKFALKEVDQAARELLKENPEDIVAFRVLREVLRISQDDPELEQVKKAVLKSKWVQQLEESQLADGSWGRFHSQEAKKKTVFHTTEEAIDRAFALGLDRRDGILVRTRQYILDVFDGRLGIPDPPEKNERWPFLVQLILAGRLAQLDPGNPLLEPMWKYWVEVAEQAFADGEYSKDGEITAINKRSGIEAPSGYLESQHALWVLSSHRLPVKLDHAIANWIWQKPNGIRYLRAALSDPQPRLIGYWLRSMNILTRFESWREVAAGTLNNLWTRREENGLWDFGSYITKSIDFPISESWRQSCKRKQDYSTYILVLLRKAID